MGLPPLGAGRRDGPPFPGPLDAAAASAPASASAEAEAEAEAVAAALSESAGGALENTVLAQLHYALSVLANGLVGPAPPPAAGTTTAAGASVS